MDIEERINHVIRGLANCIRNAKLRNDSYDQGYMGAIKKEVEKVKDEFGALLAEREQLLAQEPSEETIERWLNDFAVWYFNTEPAQLSAYSKKDGRWLADFINNRWLSYLADRKDLYRNMVLAQAVPAQQVKEIEITDQMASAFNQAICDDAMNDQDIDEVKTGLRAAISHLQPLPVCFYELEIKRLVALNDSLLANERRMLDRMRTMQPSPAVAVPDGWTITKIDNGYVIKDRDELDVTIVNGRASSGLTFPWGLMQNFLDDLLSTFPASPSPRITDHPETILSNASQWSERITEQDAYDIILNFYWYMEAFKNKHGKNPSVIEWKDAEGRALLNKLNAKPEGGFDECCASGQSCAYELIIDPEGNDVSQCQYCGKPESVGG